MAGYGFAWPPYDLPLSYPRERSDMRDCSRGRFARPGYVLVYASFA